MFALERKSDGQTVEIFKNLPSRINIPAVKIRVDAPAVDWECETHRLVSFVPPVPPEPPLAEVKNHLLQQIDADAEAIRLKYITPGDGKALAYNEIKDESLAVGNDASNPVGTAVDQLTQEQQATLESIYPLLSAEIPYRGDSYLAVANLVQAQYAGFRIVEKQIIRTLNAAKVNISAATTNDEVNSAYASINWTV